MNMIPGGVTTTAFASSSKPDIGEARQRSAGRASDEPLRRWEDLRREWGWSDLEGSSLRPVEQAAGAPLCGHAEGTRHKRTPIVEDASPIQNQQPQNPVAG